MTQFDDDDIYDRNPYPPMAGANGQARGRSRLWSVLGALAALGISVGLVVWAFHLGGQEARNIPVIKGVSSVREAPAVRGGEKYSDQNRAVYQARGDAQSGVVEPGNAPAPERPAASDLAVARQGGNSLGNLLKETPSADMRREVVRLETFRPRPGEEPDSSRSVTQPPNVGNGSLLTGRLSPPPATGGQPVGAGTTSPSAATGAAVQPNVQPMQPVAMGAQPMGSQSTATRPAAVEQASPNPVGVAPAQTTAPAATAQQQAAVAPPPTPPQASKAAPAANIDPTTPWQVQVAAVATQAEAVARWQKLQQQAGNALTGLAAEVQEAVVNGQRVFRLRLGPTQGREDAQRICERLKKTGVECFVAKR